MRFIGIDIGLTGAIGCLKPTGEYSTLIDIPTTQKGQAKGCVKRQVDANQLYQHLRELKYQQPQQNLLAVIEVVNARPQQGVSSVFSLGDSFGTMRTVCAALTIDAWFVTPVVWKQHYGLTNDKEAARTLASRLFPTAPLTLKKHHHRAEALLLAYYGYQRLMHSDDENSLF